MKRSNRSRRNNYTLEELKVLYDDFKAQKELDFHQYGILNEVAVEHIYNEFINECSDDQTKRLLLITGRGKVVRPTIEKLLKRDQRVESYQNAGRFTGGGGAFEVTLR